MPPLLTTLLCLSGLWPCSATALSPQYDSTDAELSASMPIIDLGYVRRLYHRYTSGNWKADRRLLTRLEITGDYYNFSNIRYGQAPTGPQRFRAPLEPTLNETYKIIDNGSVGRICPQASGNWSIISSAFTSSYIAGTSASFDYNAAMAALPETPPAISSSDPRTTEDCLFLDVIVPSSALAVNATQLPVLIWVHGGGFSSGEKTGFGKFNPAGLLRKADNGFIFVALNYRVGLFGFLGGDEIARDGTPNAGFYDQRLAFQWVQKHIGLFGGDKDRVTVMGGSAGAGSIMHHLTSFGGNNSGQDALFQQAILQSPAFLPAPTSATAQSTFDDLLSTLDVFSLAELRNLSSETLIAGNALQIYSHSPYGSNMYGPYVDGFISTDLPGTLLHQGDYMRDVRIMVSHNSLEGLVFTPPTIETEQNYTALLRQSLPSLNETSLKIVETLYPLVFNGSYGYTDEFGRAMVTIQDVTIVCNTRYLASAMSDRAYGIKFAVPPGIHGQETNYVFQNGVTNGVVTAVADRLQEYIVSFVMNSAPTNANGSALPVYGSQAELTSMGTAGDTVIQDDAANARCAFWQSVF
ncbi:Alpha/Beta hydrolase protein [Pestalotiopsis sp. NC0098]|nr:Alpha/Beta hydrolase protein [Pestalotiopsis sp. NC0098]